MQLSQEQLESFDREGYLFIPEAFTAEEVTALRAASDEVFRTEREEIWRESDGTPRIAFGCHTYNKAFEILSRHPRLVEPVQQLFGEDLYIHQFKVNAKAAFTGDVWQWHQDFPNWHLRDGMPEPRAMNISVFLDDVLPINGPLMFIAGTHKQEMLESTFDEKTTNYPLWSLDRETVTRLAAEGGIVAPTGKAGGLLLHHGNLVHGSAGNMTPYPRNIVYLTLSAVSNAITKPTRPEYIAHTDFTPVRATDDDALTTYARSLKDAAE